MWTMCQTYQTFAGPTYFLQLQLNYTYTVKPRFIAPRFTAKLAYRQEFLQSRFPYVVITPLKCQTRIPPSATVIEDQTVNLLLFKPRS
jgi:hypothetical protein